MRRASILLLIAVLCSCGGSTPAPRAASARTEAGAENVAENVASNETSSPGQSETHEAGAVQSPVHCNDRIAAAQGSGRDSIVAGLNDFGLEALRRTQDAQTLNASLSPASIAFALAMTMQGASGQTREEMRCALHLSASDEDVRLTMQAVLNALDDNRRPAERNRATSLYIANQLFVAQNFELVPDFVTASQRIFGAPVERLDFLHAAEASRVHINEWAEQHTFQRIRDLIPSGGVTSGTTLVLANAIYFKGQWLTRFNARDTQQETFEHAGAGPEARVAMMHKTAQYDYGTHGGAQWISLPYAASRLSMVVALPEARGDAALAAWLSHLNAAEVRDAVGSLRRSHVVLSLPKWTSHSDSIALGPVLREMGMQRAFTDGAEFPGIARESTQISEVFHKVFVDVSEEGTEAAAATAVVMTRTAIMDPPQEAVFRADHPFVYFIRDSETGFILFAGVFANPQR
ncbi:MAG: serpin family protein [Sandaracinaceae bacterium]|nr:serpin family protein [Sandaracinaceae bacterium]